MKTLALLLGLSMPCIAGTVVFDGRTITYNDQYSLKDFSGRLFIEDPDMDGLVIYGANFQKENPGTIVFPETMTGVSFYNCGLCNVVIPEGNTVYDFNHDHGCAQ